MKNAIHSFRNALVESNDSEQEKLLEWLGISSDKNKSELSQITYFTCMKLMAETVGKVPIKLYQDTVNGTVRVTDDKLYHLLKVRPNPYMTPSVFWSTVEMNRNHYGNAYVFCRYRGAKLEDLWIMPSDDVEVYIDDRGFFGQKGRMWYVYTDSQTNKVWTLDADDVMHFKTSTTFDGVKGKSIREILKDTIKGGMSSQLFMNELYDSGLTAKAVLQYTGDLDRDKKERLIKGIKEFATGKKNAGGIIPIPLGMQLTPLNIKLTDSQFFELKKYSALEIAAAFGIKPTFINQYDNSSYANSESEQLGFYVTDSQFFELKKYSALEIAAAFGIKPTFINQYDNSSYANSESEQLGFYVNTMQFVFKHYEEEITYKGLDSQRLKEHVYVKFNEHAILRADSKTQAETLKTYVSNGILKTNEARSILDYPFAEGGDQLIVNGNCIPITMVGQQYVKGGENNE